MKRTAFIGLLCSLSVLSAAEAAPANTLRELFAALTACWGAPPGSIGSSVTVGITLRRNGTMFGQPTITFSRLTGDQNAQKRFLVAALAALAACTPVSITDALGGAIAGRRILIRFGSHAPQTPT
ncbi:MAG: hypothetical protein NVSMB26_17330 [Beijerinckiaceae bacterium]